MSIEFKIVEIINKKRWNDFIASQKRASFLQSWQWGEFQEKTGHKIFRFGVEENGELVAVAMLIKTPLPFSKSYFYCPSGPIINYELRIKNDELIDFLFAEMKKVAQKEKTIFLRFEPSVLEENELAASLPLLAMTRTLDIQPSRTVILNLEKSGEELLKAMHQKTRYNIRLAEKKDVKIIITSPQPSPYKGEGGIIPSPLQEEGQDEVNNINVFWSLMEKTAERDEFRLHGRKHYEELLQVEGIKLAIGYFEDKPICSGIFSFFGDTVTYLHGASSDEHREVMAPHLLQWEMIKKAKAEGFKYYDFYGIDEKKWPGVTRFKVGFNGEEINHPGTFDLIFNSLFYMIYSSLRKLRRLF